MSNEGFRSKSFFRLNGGLNSEINELSFPDGYTKDEANYELLVDGSRRRRKGLAAESGAGSAKSVTTIAGTDYVQSYLWRNVGSDPDKNVVVTQIGQYLYFADADETVSDGWEATAVDLDGYSDTDTAATVNNVAVTFSQGRGHLFVSGPYVIPFYVEYDPDADDYTSSEIPVRIRDFIGVEDGVNINIEPTGTISDDHRYNLRNRGWSQDDMDQYNTDKSKHPAKNALWWRGYKRTYGASVAEKDGQQSWDSNKLEAEAFGNSDAPQGSLFLDPRDTTIGESIAGKATDIFSIDDWTFVDNGTTWSITLEFSSDPGLVASDTFTVSGQLSKYVYYPIPSEPIDRDYDFNGEQTVDSVSGAGPYYVTFTTTQPQGWDTGVGGSWTNQDAQLGQIDTGTTLTRTGGTDKDQSWSAIEFHAGRVFYAGMNESEYADTVFFSQIAYGPPSYATCFQAADPTDENFNALTPADGGTIVIPGMGGVVNMLSVRDSLLIFGRNGVWEVNGGRAGTFTANGYGVRQISSYGCNAPSSVERVEDSAIYTGESGIYIIAPNEFTGILEPTSVTENTIQTIWNQIPDAEQAKVQTVYEPFQKRVYFAYGANATANFIDTMLIFDSRASGFFRYTFDTPANNGLLTIFRIPNADDTSDNKAFKAIYEASTTTVQVADFDQTDFDDWDGTNGPLPYLVFGDDNVGSWQRRKQAPVITVYSKRTNTGYTLVGSEYQEDNPASTLLTPFWDWTEEVVWTDTNKTTQEAWAGTDPATKPSISGKIGKQVQVHRDVRYYTAGGTTDVDGHPVVVTRSKIRGSGRSLRLRFDGEADKDSHILGFELNYKIPRVNNV